MITDQVQIRLWWLSAHGILNSINGILRITDTANEIFLSMIWLKVYKIGIYRGHILEFCIHERVWNKYKLNQSSCDTSIYSEYIFQWGKY